LGIGSFFLTNSVTAWFVADEFKELIEAKAFLLNIFSSTTWVHLIGVNDALMFLLILSGKWRKAVSLWGIIWLVCVIYITGVLSIDTIERAGIILLLGYNYFREE